jgi:hypothetical protein
MSEWIESHANIPRHRKTKRLAKLLNLSIPSAVGFVHMLWYYALDFAPGGDLSSHTHADIADGCGWDDDPEVFIAALVSAGWLADDDGLMVHDWSDYNQSHRKRAAEAERQRRARAKNRGEKEWPTNLVVMPTCEEVSRAVTVTHEGVTPDRQDRTGQDRQDRQEEQSPLVDNLVGLCVSELPLSESTAEDYGRTIARYRGKMTDEHIERVIVDLGNWRPAKPRPKLHLTLAKWLSKEPRDPVPPSHAPAELPEYDGTEVPMPEDVKALFASIGGEI